MNNIKFLSIFIINMIVITTAAPKDNKHNLRRLLQQAPIAVSEGFIEIPPFGEQIITVTNNDYDPDGGSVKINAIVLEPERGQVEIIDDNNIQYTAVSASCWNMDKFKYNVIDYDDDNLVSNDATVLILITCELPSSESTPTPIPLGQCDDPLNECLLKSDGLIYYYKCIGESLFEYSCPSTVSCDDQNGFDEDEIVRPCTELYLSDESEDCC